MYSDVAKLPTANRIARCARRALRLRLCLAGATSSIEASTGYRTQPFRDCVIVDSNDFGRSRLRTEHQMTRPRARAAAGWKQTPPEQTPRLRLKPKAPTSGYVDGAWWPHSNDLLTELPDLIAVLSVRLGTIDRVVYNLTEWAKAPKRLLTGGQVVRLAGYYRQPANTIEVLGVNRSKMVLLVIPAQTDPDRAHTMMMAAATREDASTIAGLLATSTPRREARPSTAAVE
jgi:hypothetical protein